MLRALIPAAVFGTSLMTAAAACADCTPAQDLIGQAEVANLRAEANDADEKAAMATNTRDQMQWQQMAQNFRSQADTLEQNQQNIAQAAQQVCEAISGNQQQ